MGQNPSYMSKFSREETSDDSSEREDDVVAGSDEQDANRRHGKRINSIAEAIMANHNFTTTLSELSKKKSEKALRTEPVLPFLLVENLTLVPVHSNLVNEPWTKQDTGVRPDIYAPSSRPFFKFQVAEGTAICVAGSVLLSKTQSEYPDKEWKIETTTSIVDVYDTYGLDMAYSYLHYIYHSEIGLNYPICLAVYVVGSLAILDPEFASSISEKMSARPEATTLLTCSSLLAQLAALELKQPRLACVEITAHTTKLPIELLARIFNSKRISKEISEQVTLQRRGRDLRIRELECRARHTIVAYSESEDTNKNRVWSAIVTEGKKLWNMEHREDSFLISCTTRGLASLFFGISQKKPVLYSYKDYARMRNLDPKQVLADMIREVDKNDESTLCAWILMLVIENGDETRLEIRRDQLLFSFEFLSKRALAALAE